MQIRFRVSVLFERRHHARSLGSALGLFVTALLWEIFLMLNRLEGPVVLAQVGLPAHDFLGWT